MGVVSQTFSNALPEPSFFRRYVAAPDPGQPSREWHTSPVIDMAAYHFSWAWVLVPLLFTNSDDVYFYIYALIMGAILAHRHYGLPYAYLDDGVFKKYKRQLTWFPLLCVLLFAASPLLLMREDRGSVLSKALGAIVFFSLLWNIWHTYMQKFGILRLYLAKEAKAALKTPAWVDKYFLFCWIPLFFSYMGPKHKSEILKYGVDIRATALAIIRLMERHEKYLVLPSILIAVGGVGLWLWYEWRTQRFRNKARLSAATGTLLISTALLWADPVTAFTAFAFSHAVEYMVFVWAFQRRFYYWPRPQPPLMQRLLSHSRSWYAGFTLILVVVGAIEVLWGETIFTDMNPISFAGMTGAQWFFYYAVYQSFVHFHMDGFLWKMRRPEVINYV
jgi:hypothetical protein